MEGGDEFTLPCCLTSDETHAAPGYGFSGPAWSSRASPWG